MHILYAHAAAVEAGELPSSASATTEFLELGVGKTDSTFTLTKRLCAEPRPDLVLLFGVCGTHGGSHARTHAGTHAGTHGASHAGIDGGSHGELAVGDLCLVKSDRFADEGVQTESEFIELLDDEFRMDERLTARARVILDDPPVARSSTVSTCSGSDHAARAIATRSGAEIETMEGAAVATVCHRLGIPMVQLRCVSNRTGDRERGGWDLDAACAELQRAVRRLIEGEMG